MCTHMRKKNSKIHYLPKMINGQMDVVYEKYAKQVTDVFICYIHV